MEETWDRSLDKYPVKEKKSGLVSRLATTLGSPFKSSSEAQMLLEKNATELGQIANSVEESIGNTPATWHSAEGDLPIFETSAERDYLKAGVRDALIFGLGTGMLFSPPVGLFAAGSIAALRSVQHLKQWHGRPEEKLTQFAKAQQGADAAIVKAKALLDAYKSGNEGGQKGGIPIPWINVFGKLIPHEATVGFGLGALAGGGVAALTGGAALVPALTAMTLGGITGSVFGPAVLYRGKENELEITGNVKRTKNVKGGIPWPPLSYKRDGGSWFGILPRGKISLSMGGGGAGASAPAPGTPAPTASGGASGPSLEFGNDGKHIEKTRGHHIRTVDKTKTWEPYSPLSMMRNAGKAWTDAWNRDDMKLFEVKRVGASEHGVKIRGLKRKSLLQARELEARKKGFHATSSSSRVIASPA